MSEFAAGAFDLVERLVAACPGTVEIERREGALWLHPRREGCYSVALYDEGDEVMIACERWHAHYDDPMQAAYCAMWLLSPYYRVAHEYKGGLFASVWIERFEATGWEPMDAVYYLNPEHPKDWELGPNQKFRRIYLQQDVLRPPKPYTDFVSTANLDANGLPIPSQIGQTEAESETSIGLQLF